RVVGLPHPQRHFVRSELRSDRVEGVVGISLRAFNLEAGVEIHIVRLFFPDQVSRVQCGCEIEKPRRSLRQCVAVRLVVDSDGEAWHYQCEFMVVALEIVSDLILQRGGDVTCFAVGGAGCHRHPESQLHSRIESLLVDRLDSLNTRQRRECGADLIGSVTHVGTAEAACEPCHGHRENGWDPSTTRAAATRLSFLHSSTLASGKSADVALLWRSRHGMLSDCMAL